MIIKKITCIRVIKNSFIQWQNDYTAEVASKVA